MTIDIYYKIKAIDIRQNESAFSEPIKLARPDIIPPIAPILFKARTFGIGKVKLNWRYSNSEDIKVHKIYRSSLLHPKWEIIFENDGTNNVDGEYIDTDLNLLYEYDYKVVAYDNSGNTSESQILTAKPQDDRQKQAPLILSSSYDQEYRILRLEIQFENEPNNIKSFQFYRKSGDIDDGVYKEHHLVSRFNLVAGGGTVPNPDLDVTINQIQTTMTILLDADLQPNYDAKYFYKVLINYETGVSSMLSDAFYVHCIN